MSTAGDREVMGLMLTTNAATVAAVLRGESGSQAQSLIAAIAATRTLGLLVDDTLRALVQEARDQGSTWAEIGGALHVTRQAAFQRFGGQPAGESDAEESPKPIPDAGTKAIKILEDFLAERWDELRATFDARVAEAASLELLQSTLAAGRTTFGTFVAWGTPVCTVRGDYTVVDVPIAFEKSDVHGWVSFNVDEQVAGLYFVPADQPGTLPADQPGTQEEVAS